MNDFKNDNQYIENSEFSEFDDLMFDDNVEEPLWDMLIQKIIDGKVIPVIGPEMLTINGVDITTYLVDGLGRKLSMKTKPHSFSELVYAPEYKNSYGNRDRIYYQIASIFAKKDLLQQHYLNAFYQLDNSHS